MYKIKLNEQSKLLILYLGQVIYSPLMTNSTVTKELWQEGYQASTIESGSISIEFHPVQSLMALEKSLGVLDRASAVVINEHMSYTPKWASC